MDDHHHHQSVAPKLLTVLPESSGIFPSVLLSAAAADVFSFPPSTTIWGIGLGTRVAIGPSRSSSGFVSQQSMILNATHFSTSCTKKQKIEYTQTTAHRIERRGRMSYCTSRLNGANSFARTPYHGSCVRFPMRKSAAIRSCAMALPWNLNPIT